MGKGTISYHKPLAIHNNSVSLDPFFEDYIELNDLNVPLELEKDKVDDLMPTIEEGEVFEEFRARNDARMVSKVFGYPSDCDHDKKIHMDYAYDLKFSCMIVLEDMDAYRNEGMGDVIFGELFLREVKINARRKGYKGQKEAKSVKNRQRNGKDKSRVRNEDNQKPDQSDTARKKAKIKAKD
ncbi:hypothetical protein Tco_0144369 [Tanacetum coccineum]